MDDESKKEVGESVVSTDNEIKKSKKKKGVLSRLWNTLFRVRGDDFEKRLQHISKEEASVLGRITRRAQSWRRTARYLILCSIFFEVVAVIYAIVTTRSLVLNWKIRALKVLPMFLLPVVSTITYSALGSFTRMRDRKDKKILENLRAERQAKIDELKEKTNYYITQQLIQRYDPDPAAKAAAATVLASKLGAESGLKVSVGDEANLNAGIHSGKINDVEIARNTGLRNRRPSHSKSSSTESAHSQQPEQGMTSIAELENSDIFQQRQMVVEHHPQTGMSAQDGGWIARFAAMLVGEDPTQSYALICGNCHMHNGLARKEDFAFVTYYCPHCNALNRPKQQDERASGSSSPVVTTLAPLEAAETISTTEVASDPLTKDNNIATSDIVSSES